MGGGLVVILFEAADDKVLHDTQEVVEAQDPLLPHFGCPDQVREEADMVCSVYDLKLRCLALLACCILTICGKRYRSAHESPR